MAASFGQKACTGARIRAFFLSAFVDKAVEHQLNVGPLLRGVGISPDGLISPYSWIPLRGYISATELLAEKIGNPNLGLETGRKFSAADLGPFYTLTLAAHTLRAILDTYIRFQNHWQTCSRLELHQEGDRMEIRYRISDPDIWPRRQDAEFTLASLTIVIRQAVADQWRPLKILLEHDISGRKEALFEGFRCPVFGDQDRNAIVIPIRSLHMPLPLNVSLNLERLQAVAERHLLDLMRTESADTFDIVKSTRRLISERFGDGDLHLHGISAELGLPERTLRRHLARQGTTFRDLLQEERMRRAQQLLASRGNIPLEELAEKLGYADTASFARAFKNWSGISPRRYSRSLE